MKRFKSFYLMLSFLFIFSIISPLVVHAEPDSQSPTDASTITDNVDGNNTVVFTVIRSSSCWDKENNILSDKAKESKAICVYTKQKCKLIQLNSGKYYAYDDSFGELIECADLTEAYAKATLLDTSARLDLFNIETVLVFDENKKCLAKSDYKSILDICDGKDNPKNSFSFVVGSYNEDNTLNITLNYSLESNDYITDIEINGGSVKDADTSLTGSGNYDFTIGGASVEGSKVNWFIRTANGEQSGTLDIPVSTANAETEDPAEPDTGSPATLTFSGIPKEKLTTGDSFTLKITSDQPITLYFNGEFLNSSEEDYKKEFEYEVSYNGSFHYSAATQTGESTIDVIDIDCFEDEADKIPDDTYWNGVDDSDTKLAQTGIFNSPIFIILGGMLILGSTLIIYVLKFRKRGAINEENK